MTLYLKDPTVSVSVRVSMELREKLIDAAQRRGCSLSKAASDALEAQMFLSQNAPRRRTQFRKVA
jgi:hypothetical protein